MNTRNRIQKLEQHVQPGVHQWYSSQEELIERWKSAAERGLHLNPETGEEITLEELEHVSPVHFARIQAILNMESVNHEQTKPNFEN